MAREVRGVKNFLSEEQARWDALEVIQKEYYAILDSANLWDRQAARSYVAAGAKIGQKRCDTNKRVVLIAVADLNRSISGMLEQIASSVTCMVVADESMADRFNDFGSLITAAWLEVDIKIDDDKILIVDTPADQAFAVSHRLTHLASGTSYATDQITIGVPDATVIPQLERAMGAIDVPYRNLAGRSLGETTPVRLLIACRDYLQAQTYDSFASLVRHPDVFRWVTDTIEDDEWLGELDSYQNAHLPDKILVAQKQPFGDPKKIAARHDAKDRGSKYRAKESAATSKVLNEIHALVQDLL